AGSVRARPPDPRLLIRLSEEAAATEEKPAAEPKKPAPKKPAASIDRPVPSRAPDLRTENTTPPPPRPPRGAPKIQSHRHVPPPPPPRGVPPTAHGTAAPVPWCVLTGTRLTNLALRDHEGRPWEYQRDRKGRLVLLDFWYSECPPCLRAISELNDLQTRYG